MFLEYEEVLKRPEDRLLNQFIAAAVAEKVGCLRTVRELLQERAGSAKPSDMRKYLRRAPKVPPAAGDEVD